MEEAEEIDEAFGDSHLGQNDKRQEKQRIAQEAPQRTFSNKFQRQIPNF